MPTIDSLGWTRDETRDTRHRLASFAEDWNAPGMDTYDERSSMHVHLIATVCGQQRALNGFAPSKLDRAWFRFVTTSGPPSPETWEEATATRWTPTPVAGNRAEHQNALILGHRTWRDVYWCAAFSYRSTIVLSRGSVPTPTVARPDVWHCGSLDAALRWAEVLQCPHVWMAGGETVYREALALHALHQHYIKDGGNPHPPGKLCLLTDLYLTEIDAEAEKATVFLPALDGWTMQDATPCVEEESRRLRFTRWTPKESHV